MNDPRINELRQLLPQAMLPDWVRLGRRAARLFRDRHHPEKHELLLGRLFEQVRASIALRERRLLNVPTVTYPPELPITARKDEIVNAIRANQVVVIAGETGSGKTTQIPKMCLEAGLGITAKIGCTQPRRVAALSISRRIAEELNVLWGRQVGCKIRFDDRSSAKTYIKLMTDGILLAEAQGDPLLSDYDAIIIDEAHERSLNIDFLLGLLKGLLEQRKDLRLIITSATIDTQMFSRHFNDAPIIEVSGRMYPVEVVYQPLDAESEERGDMSYVDATVQAAERILYETNFGDVLIFMPGERDIRETSDQLDGRLGTDAEIIPLFGRLSAGDQQRVFAPSSRRKIVVATNIAETSLTIPGIRFVIDAGLARISRYNPRTRTRRLPVEPVSQSSANQRKGRAGRVQDGTCIRLYSEEDFNARPAFTQPEIQRANLAEVILRMKAFRLGDIETFPFVQPPTPAAIANGYALLQELGALDDKREITPTGADLARLPIDPTLGRMLLQSQSEHATCELLIIAAGLSIQDPRERPLDQKDAAAAAHKRFADPQSDFLALLNIWKAVHDQWEKLRTQGQRRKFCRQHFLSYLRMREWQDLYAQLQDALSELPLPVGQGEGWGEGIGKSAARELSRSVCAKQRAAPHQRSLSPSDGEREVELHTAYDAIHRSILAGLIGHVGHREERNSYKASGNRLMTVFPGSALYERGEKPVKGRNVRPPKQVAPRPKSKQPEWIVAGEIVETSQLFARTLAGIDPRWIYQVAPHCCKVSHKNPHWNVGGGRVLVEEIITLHGLEVQRLKVAYGNLNPTEATAIFIRSALVEENVLARMIQGQEIRSGNERSRNWKAEIRESQLKDATASPRAPLGVDEERRARSDAPYLPPQYRFLSHNRGVRQKIENWQTRARHHGLVDLDQALSDFYAQRIENVSSLDELNRLLRDRPDQEFLCAKESDLVGDLELSADAQAFPDTVQLAEQPLVLRYAYAPGEAWDGVTVQMPVELAQSLSPAQVEWSVPGLRAEQVRELLRSLPKSLRRELQPLNPKIEEIVRDLQPTLGSLTETIGRFLFEGYGISVPPEAWKAGEVMDHLRPRVEVMDHNQKQLASGRNLEQLQSKLKEVKTPPAAGTQEWRRAAAKWERTAITGWTFGDLPDRIVVRGSASLSGDHTVGRVTPCAPSSGLESPGAHGVTRPTATPIYAWPGIALEDEHVSIRLFRSPELARAASIAGVRRLVELSLQKDIAWLQKDLRGLSKLNPLYAPIGSGDELQETAFEHLLRHAMPDSPLPVLTHSAFEAAVAQARERLRGFVPQLSERLTVILQQRQQIDVKLGITRVSTSSGSRALKDLSQLGQPARPPAAHPMSMELEALLPARFLEQVDFEQLPQLPRYLQALLIRIERAALNPPKDKERARQVVPFQEAVKKLRTAPPKSAEGRRMAEEFRWLVEEFKVSLFAQELGTAVPVSAKRLEKQLEKLKAVC